MILTTTLWESVDAICGEIGGRALLQQDGTVRVLDCPSWTARAAARLRQECPEARVVVEMSTGSLSGFTLLISAARPALHVATRAKRKGWCRAYALAACMALVAMAVAFDAGHGNGAWAAWLNDHFRQCILQTDV